MWNSQGIRERTQAEEGKKRTRMEEKEEEKLKKNEKGISKIYYWDVLFLTFIYFYVYHTCLSSSVHLWLVETVSSLMFVILKNTSKHEIIKYRMIWRDMIWYDIIR